MKSDLRDVLLPAGGNVVYILQARRLVSGGDVILLLLRSDCVVHINLSDSSRDHHLTEESQMGLKQGNDYKPWKLNKSQLVDGPPSVFYRLN